MLEVRKQPFVALLCGFTVYRPSLRLHLCIVTFIVRARRICFFTLPEGHVTGDPTRTHVALMYCTQAHQKDALHTTRTHRERERGGGGVENIVLSRVKLAYNSFSSTPSPQTPLN